MNFVSDADRAGVEPLNLKTELPGRLVSTVRLIIDHSFGGPPLWYETMVFPTAEGKTNWSEEYCERCSTIEEAREQHERVVSMFRAKGDS